MRRGLQAERGIQEGISVPQIPGNRRNEKRDVQKRRRLCRGPVGLHTPPHGLRLIHGNKADDKFSAESGS